MCTCATSVATSCQHTQSEVPCSQAVANAKSKTLTLNVLTGGRCSSPCSGSCRCTRSVCSLHKFPSAIPSAHPSSTPDHLMSLLARPFHLSRGLPHLLRPWCRSQIASASPCQTASPFSPHPFRFSRCVKIGYISEIHYFSCHDDIHISSDHLVKLSIRCNP